MQRQSCSRCGAKTKAERNTPRNIKTKGQEGGKRKKGGGEGRGHNVGMYSNFVDLYARNRKQVHWIGYGVPQVMSGSDFELSRKD